MIMIDMNAVAEAGIKLIRFPDVKNNYEPMFYLEDGKNLTVQMDGGELITNPCKQVGSHHFYFGNNCFHIDQFAELNHRNCNTCLPPQQPTDLSLYRKTYADRTLKDEDGKLIPYRALVGFDVDRYGTPGTALLLCPQAAADRQVCVRRLYEENGTTKASNDFYSMAQALRRVLPKLPMSRYEQKLVCDILDEQLQRQPHKPLSEQITGAQQRKAPAPSGAEHAQQSPRR